MFFIACSIFLPDLKKDKAAGDPNRIPKIVLGCLKDASTHQNSSRSYSLNPGGQISSAFPEALKQKLPSVSYKSVFKTQISRCLSNIGRGISSDKYEIPKKPPSTSKIPLFKQLFRWHSSNSEGHAEPSPGPK
jgi:hypothetical protein